jgi:hypothetical protein
VEYLRAAEFAVCGVGFNAESVVHEGFRASRADVLTKFPAGSSGTTRTMTWRDRDRDAVVIEKEEPYLRRLVQSGRRPSPSVPPPSSRTARA